MADDYREEALFAEQVVKEAWQYVCVNNSGLLTGKVSSEQLAGAESAIEKFVRARLRQRFSSDTVLSEEEGIGIGMNGRCWVIDPLDGVTNFARGSRSFGIQLALCVKAVPVLVVIWLPLQLDCYVAVAGEGAFRNGRRLVLDGAARTPLVVAVGDFSQQVAGRRRQQEHVCAMTDMGCGIRIFGAPCLDLTALACGSVDAVVNHGVKFWDVLAGVALVREAGGVVLDLGGDQWHVGAGTLVAARSRDIAALVLSDVGGGVQ